MTQPLVEGNPSADAALVHLFDAATQFTSESPADAVVPPEGREGVYLGSGDGIATGERVRGKLRWSFYSGNCVYPQIRRGEAVPEHLHLCSLNPGGYIESDDGARIAFDGKGYGLRSPERYRVSMTMAFRTDDARYAWLNRVLGVMEGDSTRRQGSRRGTFTCRVDRVSFWKSLDDFTPAIAMG